MSAPFSSELVAAARAPRIADETTDLVQRLRHQGTRVEEIVYPDEIHDLLLWRSRVDAYRATAAFFAREL